MGWFSSHSIKMIGLVTIVSKRSKKIDVKFHFARGKIFTLEICLENCSTTKVLADLLTKSLDHILFTRFKTAIVDAREGIEDIKQQCNVTS